jgi:HNH endonuclease
VKERWKEIFDGYYEISSYGRVRRAKPGQGAKVGRLIGGYVDKNNPYVKVCIGLPGRRKTFYVHQLVSKIFLGPCPPGKEPNHIDGDKTNNRSDNFGYLTRRKNVEHAIRLGLRDTAGVKNVNAKLTEEMVKRIRHCYGQRSATQAELAEEFDVSQVTIFQVLTRRTWRHVK